MKWKFLKKRTRLNLIGAFILVLGLGSAIWIYREATNVPFGAWGYEIVDGTVYPIMPQDSKMYRHNLELYGGKMNVIMDDFNRWFLGLWHGRSLALIIGCTTILIAFGFFYVANFLIPRLKSNTEKKIVNIILVLAIILSRTTFGYAENLRDNFIVAIDIGHTKIHGGALSAHGIDEYYYNQKVASLLLPELIKNGFKKSFIINEDGGDIPLIDRTIEARSRKADLLISIHHDSVQPYYLSKWEYQGESLYYCDMYKGFCILISDNNLISKSNLLFAEFLGSELLNMGFKPTLHHAEQVKGENRKLINKEKGIYEFNKLLILKTATMPAVLLECGIIKNRREEKSINSDYRNKLVSAIVSAVMEYHDKFNNKK